jgi:hypothetical protein
MTAKRAPVHLQFQMTEESGNVRMLLIENSVSVIDFEHSEAPSVRVIGFNDRHKSEEYVAAFVGREEHEFGSKTKAIDALINSHERQIYDKSRLLRRELRKLAMLGHTLRSAKKARAILLEEDRSLHEYQSPET